MIEKEGIFYKRSDLTLLEVRRLIVLWEGDAGESFSDYFGNYSLGDSFMDFLSLTYSKLHDYCYNQSIPPEGLEDVIRYCEEYYIGWVLDENYEFFEEAYKLSLYPLAHFLLKDDKGWEAFVEFFTSTSNTSDGTPWIDCYNIRKDFENGEF